VRLIFKPSAASELSVIFEIEVGEMKYDIPNYPDLAKGIKWGAIWGSSISILAFMITYNIPRSPDEIGFERMNPEVIFKESLFTSFWVFIFVFLIFGVLASFRPKLRKKR
jgi:hypothetical protein